METFKKLLTLLVTTSFMAGTAHAVIGDVHELSFDEIIKPSKETELEIDERYYEISTIKVEEVANPKVPNYVLSRSQKNLGEVIMSVDKLIAIGKKVWKIVEAGRPVVETNFSNPLHVLPRVDGTGVAFYEMENWSNPSARSYKVTYENGFGMDVVSFVYTVSFQHSGTYKGKGSYLTGLVVEASNVSVSWGFNFDAKSTVVTISNKGSKANPVASATIQISYVASSVLREIRTAESFHVDGRGRVSKIR